MKRIELVSDTINSEDIYALCEWLSQKKTPKLTKGALTVELEKAWAKKIGTRYSVFVNSGSSAILLTLAAMKQMGILKKIVVPALSWATDVSSPMLLGIETLFCDCNPEDLSCDLNELEKIFRDHKPDALILVSPLGLVPRMSEIIDLCNHYGVDLLEDVCESAGSKHNGQYLGTFGYASFFSTYYGHHISTMEGGFINTDDEDLYHMLLMMRSHGWDRDLPRKKQMELRWEHNRNDFEALYSFYVPGFNLRATDLQAFIGLRMIDRLDGFARKRFENFKLYQNLIRDNILNLADCPEDTISNMAFPICSHRRYLIAAELELNGIEYRPLIAGNMATQPMCSVMESGRLHVSGIINDCGFYLPNHQDLSFSDIERICRIINETT